MNTSAKRIRTLLLASALFFSSLTLQATEPVKIVQFNNVNNPFVLADSSGSATLLVSPADFEGVLEAAKNLQNDLLMVTGHKPEIGQQTAPNQKKLVIIGTIGKSTLINQLVETKKLEVASLNGQWESFVIQTIANPFAGCDEALVIAGSDKRGTIYGIYELSRQIGVSPWYWWADVPIEKHASLYVARGRYVTQSPKVKYRGIFINDEAPALSGWVGENYGKFNHEFYGHVFELILRLRGNFIWPAMWGRSLFDDDPLNAPLADKLGVVVGTSHHEPMCRAQAEWHRYGSGPWDYTKNQKVLTDFWTKGFEQNKNYEQLVTIGMRGDGDEPMSEESNIALLEKIVTDQRQIIANVSGKKPQETPQVWALYKEVQDYYDKGMRVPDDVTLLLCDDNWGNIRKLPDVNAPVHPGGYGIYYHVDYVGGPRNYKWLNVSQIQRIWEQMSLAYSHNADRLWVLNVGDIKPMEFPMSFFLDMAWDPTQYTAQNLNEYTLNWCTQQFGEKHAPEAARILNLYTKYNHRVTPELLNASTYSLDNYNEFETVRNAYRDLTLDALRLYNFIPNQYKDAFDQLVLFPTNATSNVYDMYFAVAKNQKLAAQNNPEANYWADVAQQCYNRDTAFTIHYNQQIANGKWNHMMDQVRIGYTYWNNPPKSAMPNVVRVAVPEIPVSQKVFYEANGYVSIEAANYQKAHGTSGITWQEIPDLGKTASAITTVPQNAYPKVSDSVYVEYNIAFTSTGTFDISVLVSPTLNFNANKGLRYAISVNGGTEQVVNINQTYDNRQMEHWQANRINQTKTRHTIAKAGIYTLRIRVLEPGLVLQKILIDTGGLKPSYLGAPQSELK